VIPCLSTLEIRIIKCAMQINDFTLQLGLLVGHLTVKTELQVCRLRCAEDTTMKQLVDANDESQRSIDSSCREAQSQKFTTP